MGYTQGNVVNPTYNQVCSGNTGHTEAVEVTFHPEAVSVDELLTVFWGIHNPTTLNRQGNDQGTQYRSGIYYSTDFQKAAALASKERESKMLADPIVTEILPHAVFYPAEDYHQQYLMKGGQCAKKGELEPIRCYG